MRNYCLLKSKFSKDFLLNKITALVEMYELNAPKF